MTDKPLLGANIFFQNTSMGASTDIDGDYRISEIPPGDYVLEVSYIGYLSKTFNITIKDGETKIVDIVLSPDLIEMETTIITAQAIGQVSAINQQVRSNTIINVISEEKIQELPDANAAEAIGRLPGVALQRSGGEANKVVLRGFSPRFSSVTVDGVRISNTGTEVRDVDLSSVSQRNLAGIELFKALTSDMDADAIAGSVNLVTQKAPEDGILRAEARGSYNSLEDSYKQYDFSLKWGQRFLENKLGIQATGNLENRIRSREEAYIDYDTSLDDGNDYLMEELELRYFDETRDRKGFSLLIDYQTPDGGTVKSNTVYNYTNRHYKEHSRNYPTNEELLYVYRDREADITTFNSFINGNNYLYGFDVDWSISYAGSNTISPYDYEITFTEPSVTIGDSIISGMGNVPVSALKKGPEYIIPYALNNFDLSYLYSAFYRGEESSESEITGFTDITKNYVINTTYSGALKFGAKYRVKSRTREQSELFAPYYNYGFYDYTRMENGSYALKDFTGTRFEDLAFGGSNILFSNFVNTTGSSRDLFDIYKMYPLIEEGAMRDWYSLNKNGYGNAGPNNPEYNKNIEPDANYYDMDERVGSIYVMNTLNIGQDMAFIAGIRLENEDNDYRSRYSPTNLSGFPVPAGAIVDTFATHEELVVLPNFHFTIRPTDYLSVRLAAYKALSRPDFNHRLENFVARSAGTFYSGNTVIVGNPDLKAAEAWNFEINTSLYENKFGLFSVSAFYKDIQNMYHLMNGIPLTNGQEALDSLGINYTFPFPSTLEFALTYPYNSTSPTRVWGMEMEIQTYFHFLPGFLSNFVFNGNISIMRSETYIPQSDEIIYYETIPGIPFPVRRVKNVVVEKKQKLEGQPEIFGNLALGYDIGGFSGRISVFHQGEYNISFSPNGRSDSVRGEYTRVDLSFKQNIWTGFDVFLNFNNITDTEEKRMTRNNKAGWTLVRNLERYGPTLDLGIRVTM